MDTLYSLLKENSKLYKLILDLEYKKYEAVIKNDTKIIDEIVMEEQVYYMKVRGLEQKREKILQSIGMDGKTLKEIIESNKDETLKEQYIELNKILNELKKINGLLKTVIEAQIRKIDKAMRDLGEKENTYTISNGKNNTYESLLISEKI